MTSTAPRPLGLAALLGLVALLVGCEGSKAAIDDAAVEGRAAADAVQRSAGEAADGTRSAAAAAKRSAVAAVDDTRAKAEGSAAALSAEARDLAQKTGDATAALWADIPSTGELSGAARAALTSSADKAAALVAAGAQIAPKAIELAKALNEAVDHETRIEPIFQGADPASQAAVDAAIADMPRVEVIDGVKVGFREMTEWRTDRHVRETGYLVLWRQGDHLIGVVYRSRRVIDVDALIREAPKMLALAREIAG